MENEKQHDLSQVFIVTSISRRDLTHPLVGFTINEANKVSDEQMREMAKMLANNFSNQIMKSSIKIVADVIIKKKQ